VHLSAKLHASVTSQLLTSNSLPLAECYNFRQTQTEGYQ